MKRTQFPPCSHKKTQTAGNNWSDSLNDWGTKYCIFKSFKLSWPKTVREYVLEKTNKRTTEY